MRIWRIVYGATIVPIEDENEMIVLRGLWFYGSVHTYRLWPRLQRFGRNNW